MSISRYMSVFDSERIPRLAGISPRVVRFVEGRITQKVVSIEQCLDADGYRLSLDSGDFVMVSRVCIENLESEFSDQRRMDRNQFENMMMQEQAVDRVHFPSDIHPEHCDGTTNRDETIQTIHGAKFNMRIEDELGEAPESGVEKFLRSLRKVYWHRYLKNKLK